MSHSVEWLLKGHKTYVGINEPCRKKTSDILLYNTVTCIGQGNQKCTELN